MASSNLASRGHAQFAKRLPKFPKLPENDPDTPPSWTHCEAPTECRIKSLRTAKRAGSCPQVPKRIEGTSASRSSSVQAQLLMKSKSRDCRNAQIVRASATACTTSQTIIWGMSWMTYELCQASGVFSASPRKRFTRRKSFSRTSG